LKADVSEEDQENQDDAQRCSVSTTRAQLMRVVQNENGPRIEQVDAWAVFQT